VSTAPEGPDHGYDVAGDDPGCDTVEAGDLLDDPRTDAEALCLCSLLWSSSGVARTITDALTPDDFERPVYGELFTVIAAQIEARKPHDPASIAAALTQAGKTGGHRGTQLARALSDTTMAGSPPEAAGHYAITVVAAAYRRSFHTAAASLTAAAQQLPQAQLFEHLVSIGRGQRTATARLDRITTALR
jgi:replicative DNA helicase